MAISSRRLDVVLIVDHFRQTYFWTTPSLAARMGVGGSSTHLELIDEAHKDYAYWLQKAGPKPEINILPNGGMKDVEE